MHFWDFLVALFLAIAVKFAGASLAVTQDVPTSVTFKAGELEVKNVVIAGLSSSQDVEQAEITWTSLSSNVVQISAAAKGVPKDLQVVFEFGSNDTFYGVWEYPWNGTINNQNVVQPDRGIFDYQPGINWANARAPFFFSKSGVGVYVKTESVATFDFTQPDRVAISVNGTGAVQYIVVSNEDLTQLLTTYAGLSSTISLPPDSGYGPIFWSDDSTADFHAGVTNAQENFYDFANHLWAHKIRATAMFADRPYGTGNMSFGNFDFDPKFFPSPKQFIGNLSSFGLDFQVWVANRAFLYTELYNTSQEHGWLFPGVDPVQFLGPALNLSIPEAYAYFRDKLAYFTSVGVKGFKIDRGEEHEMPDAEQNHQMVLFEQLCDDVMTAAWGKDSTSHYSFARSVYDTSRSVTAVWNGDSEATFEGLRYTVASAIRAGLLGFSQWGSDTGGYLRSATTPTEEVWARWMHFSAFSPMYEIMIGTGHTPWYDYSDRLVQVLKLTTDLHTRLIPYIRSYTYQATQTGIPVMRALFLEYPADESTYTAADAFAFGSEFLVAPIISEGGNRTVYFPKGKGKFLEYFNKTAVYPPGSSLDVVGLPLEYSPAYVREGAIVPTGDIYQGNAKWDDNWKPYLEIEIFPSYAVQESSFEYFKGEGKGTANITVTTDSSAKSVTVKYDDFGVNTTLVVYGKGSPFVVPVDAGGKCKTVQISKFDSLFD